MHSRFLFTALIFLGLSAAAQPYKAQGYIITPQFDTLRCRIVLPRDYSFGENDRSFSDSVEVVTGDSTRRYGPKELIGFGIRLRPLEAHYRAALSSDGSRWQFCRALGIGPRLTLYYVPHAQSDRPLPVADLRRAILCLHDAKGRLLFLENTMSRGDLRRVLRDYLKDEPALQALAGRKVQSFRDLDGFVAAANALPR